MRAYLGRIFQRQEELWEKYKKIEPDLPESTVNINSYDGQVVIKDFLWRITEELAESLDAAGKDNKVHQLEELSDALHFFAELFLIVDMEPESGDMEELIKRSRVDTPVLGPDGVHSGFENTPLNFGLACLRTIMRLGLVGNSLKYRPWKQNPVETDPDHFEFLLNQAFISFLGCFDSCFVTPDDIYKFYMDKSEINKQRQEGGY